MYMDIHAVRAARAVPSRAQRVHELEKPFLMWGTTHQSCRNTAK